MKLLAVKLVVKNAAARPSGRKRRIAVVDRPLGWGFKGLR